MPTAAAIRFQRDTRDLCARRCDSVNGLFFEPLLLGSPLTLRVGSADNPDGTAVSEVDACAAFCFKRTALSFSKRTAFAMSDSKPPAVDACCLGVAGESSSSKSSSP